MSRRLSRFVMPAAAVLLLPALTAVQPAKEETPSEAETLRQLDQFMDVFERVRSEYVEKVDDKTLMQGAINGMLTSLDPHSNFLETT